ncbi:MAG: endolytic transglycosylase MltG [Elusimicrobia bacterium]|nr:endolytic transglycosylase MltG [Elusimicrobiota bacterium]
MIRRRWIGLAGAFIVLLIVPGLIWVNLPPSGNNGGLVEITPGASARRIARQLRAGGHVRSALWLEVLARAMRADQKLRAGFYRVAPRQRADQILGSLLAGRGATVKVTLPEGFAVWQMAQRLEAVGVCRGVDFLTVASPWEGFLFPDTYFFDPLVPAGQAVKALRDRFQNVWGDVIASAVKQGALTPLSGPINEPESTFRLSNGRRWTTREIVTLASMIERESGRADERTTISAVYHNRLKIGMRMECDPTVQYALGGWKNPLYKKDLQVDSPYNTYRRYGLPPGPIASPGRDSLVAALAPAPVNFLYFVSDRAGGHRFSVSFEDHLKAVRHLRRLQKRE